jgi:hypothetical protein
MEPTNNNQVNLPDGPQLSPAGGNAAVGGQSPQETPITLSELNKGLGKDFKDKDTALKSLKDTQSYVAQVGTLKSQLEKLQSQPSSPQASGEIADLKAQLNNIQTENFFERNAPLKAIRTTVEAFTKAQGKTLQEVAELPEIKELLVKVSGFEQSQKMRTVLESNPRLASMQDKMTKAQELAATKSRKAIGEAADIAVSAVMDAYPEYSEPSGPPLR